MPIGKKYGGRTKGTPNKATASVKRALEEAFNGIGGVAALIEWGKANQEKFYPLWVKMLPKVIETPDLAPQSPQELDARIEALMDKMTAKLPVEYTPEENASRLIEVFEEAGVLKDSGEGSVEQSHER